MFNNVGRGTFKMTVLNKILMTVLVLFTYGACAFFIQQYLIGDKYIVSPQYIFVEGYWIKATDGVEIPKLTPELQLELFTKAFANSDSATQETLLKAVNDELSKSDIEKSSCLKT
jgi:hypothetical protein